MSCCACQILAQLARNTEIAHSLVANGALTSIMKEMHIDRNVSHSSHNPNKGTHRRRIAMVAAMCYLTTVPEGAAEVVKTQGGIHTIGLMLNIARQEKQGLKKAYLGACLMNVSHICGLPEFSHIVASELKHDDAAHIIDLLLHGETHIYMYGVYAIMGFSRVRIVSTTLGKLNVGHALCSIAHSAMTRLQKDAQMNSQQNDIGQAQRDMKLVEAVGGALAMLSMCASNKLHLVNSGALKICADVLSLSIATDCALQMCINCIWRSIVKKSKWSSGENVLQVQQAVQEAVIDLRVPKILADRVRNIFPTSIHLRVLAMNVFEVLATSTYVGTDAIAQSGGDPDVLEKYYLDLVHTRRSAATMSTEIPRSSHWERVNFRPDVDTGSVDDLQECGAQGLARRALLPGRKKVIADAGGMEALMSLMTLKHARNSTLCKAAHALMNLTASPKLQISKAVRKGVATLVQHAVNPMSKELHMFTIRILKNMSRHYKNRTILYREELRLKAHAAAETAQRQRARELERRRSLMDPYGTGVIRADAWANKLPAKVPESSKLEKTQKMFGEWLLETFQDVQPSKTAVKASQKNDSKSKDLSEYERMRPLLELEKPRVSLMHRRSKSKTLHSSYMAGRKVRPATARADRRRSTASSANTIQNARPGTAHVIKSNNKVCTFVRPQTAAPASTVDLSQLLRKSMTSTWYDPAGIGTSPRSESAIRGVFSGPVGPLSSEDSGRDQGLSYTPRMPPTPRPQSSRQPRTASSRWRTNATPKEVIKPSQVPDLRLAALETSTNFLQPITDDAYKKEWGWDNWSPRITNMRMEEEKDVKAKDEREGGLLHVTLRPQSARSRFVFNRRPYRPAPNVLRRRGGSRKVTSHRTVTENLNGMSLEKTEAELNVSENDIAQQRRREEQSFKDRPVRLWKWNHVKGSSAISNVQTYAIPVPKGSHSVSRGDDETALDQGTAAWNEDEVNEIEMHDKNEEDVSNGEANGAAVGIDDMKSSYDNLRDAKESVPPPLSMPSQLAAAQGERDQSTCSFFNLVRIHEAESPLAVPQDLERLIYKSLGQDSILREQLLALLVSPRLPILNLPNYKSLPPAPLPRRYHVLGPTTSFITKFSDALRLEARPTKREDPLFSLKSLMRAKALRPKHPTLKAFKARRIISDSRAMCESPDMYRRAFAADWARVVRKQKTLWTALGVHGSGKEHEEHEMEWIRRAIVKHYKSIFHAFTYYACLDGASSDAFTMSLSEVQQCLKDCGFLDVSANDAVSIRLLHDIGTVFVRTNIEERVDQDQKTNAKRKKKKKKHSHHHKHRRRSTVKGVKKVKKGPGRKEKDGSEGGDAAVEDGEKSLEALERQERENEVNPDRGLMRFEFVEFILRLSVRAARTMRELKSEETKIVEKVRTVAECFESFCTKHLGSKLPRRARFNHDVWRCDRLYTERMDKLLQKNRSWLIELFKRYCDYTYEFEKKSGIKHFTKNHGQDIAGLSVAMVENESTVRSEGSTTVLGIETASIASNSTTKSKKKKRRPLHHGKKGKKKKRTFVSSLMPLKGWLKFLRDAKLIGNKMAQVTNRDATLLFVYSKMGVVEEVEHRFLFVRMNECSFFEALARLAEYLRVPTNEEIDEERRERMLALAVARTENSDIVEADEVDKKKAEEEKKEAVPRRRMHTVVFKNFDRLAVFGDDLRHDDDGVIELADRLAPMLDAIKSNFGLVGGIDE